jgi:regulator of protease activity HflC (stomatin/prohibitin superfamily)
MMAFRDEDAQEYYVAKMKSISPKSIGIIAGAVLAAILLIASIAYVPAGHVGVLVLFGRVTDNVLPEGTHIVNPLLKVYRMSVRTQELKEQASVPSREGLLVTLDTSLLFRLNDRKANQAFQTIGPNYIQVVVEPNLRSAIRSITAAHSANALYTGEREQVAQAIAEELRRELEPRGIEVQSVLLRDIQLPQVVRQAIEAKQQAEQEALRMQFVLERETREAERKRIEAAGIADFQRIVAQGISQQLLTWKGIEATEKLAQSNNSKVVVIGAGRSGLPLILSSD